MVWIGCRYYWKIVVWNLNKNILISIFLEVITLKYNPLLCCEIGDEVYVINSQNAMLVNLNNM